MTSRLPIALCCFPLCALAQQADQSVPAPARVEITASSPQESQRDASVGRAIVGRDEIARYGDGNLAQVLARVPGLSVAGSEIRMRGLGAGYTAILIDGEPAPQGFSIDSLSPDMIERIEVMRSAVADRSAQAIAGSVNLVLRKRVRAGQHEQKASVLTEHGDWSPAASVQIGGSRGALAFTLTGTIDSTVTREHYGTDERIAGGATRRRIEDRGAGRNKRVNLSQRLAWSLDGGDTVVWQTLAGLVRSDSVRTAREQVLAGSATAYPDNAAYFDAHTATLRSDLAWGHRFAGAGKLNAKALVDTSRRRSDYLFLGAAHGSGGVFARQVAAGADETSLGMSGKYVLGLGAAHSLGIGWDAGRTLREESRHQTDRLPGSNAAGLRLQDYRAIVDRLALFAQDEWELSPALQLYAGIRWEGMRTATTGRDMTRIGTHSNVASPVLQLLWKLRPKRQVRMALAHTYKAPFTRDLVPRRYTINNNNSALNPDIEGNPDLRPESSWGIDLAFETFSANGGAASLSAYARSVSDVTAQILYQDGPSWVTRPVNHGQASVAGVELELKRRIRAGALPLEARVNLARNWSRMERVPGPDNRLDAQVPLTGSAALDYAGGGAWSAGASLSYQGASASLSPSGVRAERGAFAALDLVATRRLDQSWLLRVSGTNVTGRDRRSARSYRVAREGESAGATVADAAPSLRIQVERRL